MPPRLMTPHDHAQSESDILHGQDAPGISDRPSITKTKAVGYFRWVICGLLFLGMTKNYMDRWVISVLKDTLQQHLHWTEIDYGNLVFAFQAAYAVGLLISGPVIDKVGARIGYAVAVAFWSLSSMAQGLVQSFAGFYTARWALGLNEAAVFPASLKAVAEWFPKKERAFAIGIMNAGTNVGAFVASLLVPWITLQWGWRWAFLLVGGLGFVWLAAWLWIYGRPEHHRQCSSAELNYIQSDREENVERVPWLSLLGHRQTWAYAIGKFLIDPVWWFYLYWVPDFLQRKHGVALKQIGLPIFVIYLIADVGSILGGWISSHIIARGSTVNAGRKTALFLCAIGAIPIVLVTGVQSTWQAVLLIGLAAAAHQGFSSNLFTLPSDMFPQKAVASVVGIGGMAGAAAGMIIAKVVSYTLQFTGSYTIPFIMAGCTYLIALAVIQVLAPKLKPVAL